MIHDLSAQTLANWRHHDRVAGRDGAPEGFPVYKRFGKAVRYLLDPQQGPEAIA